MNRNVYGFTETPIYKSDYIEVKSPQDPPPGLLTLYAGQDGFLHTLDSSGTDSTLSEIPAGSVTSSSTPAVDNNVVTYDGITGKVVQDSGVGIASLITNPFASNVGGGGFNLTNLGLLGAGVSTLASIVCSTLDYVGAMTIGALNATSLAFGRSGITSTFLGPITSNEALTATGTINCNGGLSRSTAGAVSMFTTANNTGLTMGRVTANMTLNSLAMSLVAPSGVTTSAALGVAGVFTANSGTGNSFNLPASRGTNGQALVSNGSTAPTWSNMNKGIYTWASDLTANSYMVYGGLMTSPGEAADSPYTQVTVIEAGTITRMGYRSGSADATTGITILVNYVPITQYLINSNGTVVTSVPVVVGDFVSVQHTAGTNPGQTRINLIVT